jgi:hypothetical protein
MHRKIFRTDAIKQHNASEGDYTHKRKWTDLVPILPNTIFQILQIFIRFSYKYVCVLPNDILLKVTKMLTVQVTNIYFC